MRLVFQEKRRTSKWQTSQQVQIGGETVTYGDCEDPRYPGKKFVSIGSRYDHTTFIVDRDYADISAIRSRGTDKGAWHMIAVAVTSGYWD